MKLLFILRIPPPFGGGEIVSEELYYQLKDRYKFKLITFKKHNKEKQSREDIYAFMRGIKYIFIACKSILFKDIDCVYLGIPKTFGAFVRSAIVIGFARLLKKKVYGEIHGMNFEFAESKTKKVFLIKTINKIEKIRVLSNSIKEYLEILGYQNKIYVIDNGVSIPCFNMKNQTNDVVQFLYIGAISKKKGINKTIELLTKLTKNNYNNWKLSVIGEWVDQSEKDEIFRIINREMLIHKIKFHGIKIGDDKWQFMSDTNLHLHFTEYDGQPLTIIETMGLGIPAISTKVGAIPEMIQNGYDGFLVDNYEQAYNLLVQACLGKLELNKISKNCKQKYFDRFRPKIMAEKIHHMIED